MLDLPGGLSPARRIQIRGIQLKDQAWQIDLRKKGGKYVYFHFSPQPKEKCVIRKTFFPNPGNEEKDGGFPFESGCRFTLELAVNDHEYQVTINGKLFCKYKHRTSYTYVDQLVISGDVQVVSVNKVDNPWKPCSDLCTTCVNLSKLSEAEREKQFAEVAASKEAANAARAKSITVESTAAKMAKKGTTVKTEAMSHLLSSSVKRPGAAGSGFDEKYATKMIEEKKSMNSLLDSDYAAQIQTAIIRCQQAGELFLDPTFPPNSSSLYKDPASQRGNTMVRRWRRPLEFCPGDPYLFKDGVSAGDVMQGKLGDCWFLGALAIVASRDHLFQKLFAFTEMNHLGVYSVRFYHNGDWKIVTIDDLLPCDAFGRPVYARCSDANEIWAPLVEKAYAKLKGCYEELEGGRTIEGLVDLTGGAPEEYSFESNQEEIKSGVFWKKLLDWHQSGHLLGCSRIDGHGYQDGKQIQGVFSHHAYSILDVQEVEGNRMVDSPSPP